MSTLTIIPSKPGAPTPWDDLAAVFEAAPDRWDWAAGDAALTRLAGGPIRSRLLWRRIQNTHRDNPAADSGVPGPDRLTRTLTRAIHRAIHRATSPVTVTALTQSRWHVTRAGHLPLYVERVAIRNGDVTRTAIITPSECIDE